MSPALFERIVDGTVTDLGAEAEARWAELDDSCRLPDDLHQKALGAGLFRTLVPAELHGLGGSPVDWFHVGVELARHEASMGWVVTQGAAALGWLAAGGDPSWALEVLADPLGSTASSIAGAGSLVVDGDEVTVSGRWAFNSGAHGATWIGGAGMVTRADGAPCEPEIRFGFVPADRAEIIEDWDPPGMRGTGSNSTAIQEQTIPWAWTFRPSEATGNDRGPYRCVVGNGNWPIAGSVATTQLGVARRAIDEAREIVCHKAPSPDFQLLSENSAVQRTLLRAEGAWTGCIAAIEDELDSMWDQAHARGELTSEQRVRLFTANAVGAERAVEIVNDMCTITGTAAMDRTHPLSRCRRDAHGLHGHFATNGSSMEAAAKVSLGLIEADIRI